MVALALRKKRCASGVWPCCAAGFDLIRNGRGCRWRHLV